MPRHIGADEIPALGKLVDEVFADGREGVMLAGFPRLFHPDNASNLLVMDDGDRIVSHVGMIQRWASLGGCTVRVACVGAVATAESHRGKGMATQLFQAACTKTRHDGVDFMLISGGRGLYLRAGAEHVGRDFETELSPTAVESVIDDAVSIGPYSDADLRACVEAYNRKLSGFLRPLDDWVAAHESGLCMLAPFHFIIVRRRGVFAGYLIVSEPRDGVSRIFEHAGDAHALAAALPLVMAQHAIATLGIHLQPGDAALKSVLEAAGIAFTKVASMGTLLLINTSQLLQRLHPWFEMQGGEETARLLTFIETGGAGQFRIGDYEHHTQDLAVTARLLFGQHDAPLTGSVFDRLFPVPGLWYGLNYI
jgi:predicted N-acetyltransferase YhbS